MKISPNFDRAEFRCNCGQCGLDTADIGLVTALEGMRAHFTAKLGYETTVTILSGMRCKDHNKIEGGAKKSLHLQAKAADILVEGVEPSEAADFFESVFPDSCGIGRYTTWTHFDCRDTKARWDKT